MPIIVTEPTGTIQPVVQARLADLLDACLDEFPVRLRDPDIRREYVGKLSALAVVVEYQEEDQVTGAVALYANDFENRAAFITMIGVDPAHRRKGIGKTLLKSAFEYLSKTGFKRVSLSVLRGNPAITLYEAFGFQRVREDDGSVEMVAEVRS
ncbi:MAG: GNAT family N-acetyltransferase [Pseudomonadota bacterium]